MAEVKRFSHLPLIRFSTAAMMLAALDSLLCIALWLAGGDTLYMEESVTSFSFTHSTFDLACLAVVRSILLAVCFYYLEYFSLKQASLSGGSSLRTSRLFANACRVGIFLLCLASFAYAAVKDGLVLREVRRGAWSEAGSPDSPTDVHVTYKALFVVALVFPLVELGLGVISWYFMWRLTRVQKLRLVVNATDDDTAPAKKKKRVDIRRLFLLARPVSQGGDQWWFVNFGPVT